MEAIIQQLDRCISAARPEYYALLAAPLTSEAIAALETQYGTSIPEDLKALYRWKNGQQSSCYQSFVNNSTFMPLEEVLSSAKELDELIPDFDGENWWRKGWLPVFHNGGGDHICYDTEGTFTGRQGQLVEFWHADSDRNVIAASLEELLHGLVRLYEAAPADKKEAYFTVKAEAGYPKAFEA